MRATAMLRTHSTTPQQPRCDFCTTGPVAFAYPARDFQLTAVGSTGAARTMQYVGYWGACPPCHDLIEAGQWNRLAKRSLAVWQGQAPREVLRQLLPYTLAIHRRFVKYRTGDAVPIDEWRQRQRAE